VDSRFRGNDELNAQQLDFPRAIRAAFGATGFLLPDVTDIGIGEPRSTL
jgi:hypothetical protein